MYASTMTRPDIAFAVSCLTRRMRDPTQTDWTAAKRVIRYLKGSIDLNLEYNGRFENILVGFSDADYAGNLESRKSTSGICFFLGGGAISWSTKLQDTIALSTAEAELLALSSAVQEAIYLRKLIFEIDASLLETGPTTIYEDNQACIAMTANMSYSAKTKHIDIKYHSVKDKVDKRYIKIVYRPTTEQVADGLTKPLQDNFS